MYICLCNPFTDKELERALNNKSVPKKASHVYTACSGGEKPCCGACVCEIRDRIATHTEQAVLVAAE